MVLEQIVLETIQKVAEYIAQFEPVFLYLFAKKHKLTKAQELKNAKFKLEQSKARVAEIDRVLTKLYEDNALGKITDDRFERLSATYEKEQRELAESVAKAEADSIMQLSLGLNFRRTDHRSGTGMYVRERLRRVLMAKRPNRSNYESWQYQQYLTVCRRQKVCLILENCLKFLYKTISYMKLVAT